MKILIIGNHTCGNRGDGAILRGLIQELESQIPNVDLTLVSRFPTSSEFLLSRPFVKDWLYKYQKYSGGIVAKVKNKLHKPALLERLISSAKNTEVHDRLPPEFKTYIEEIKQYDCVVQVGGSFFVDLYGTGQFHHSLCVLAANKPLYFMGHSVGPFEDQKFCEVAELVFSKTKVLGLRESVSKKLLEDKFSLPASYVEGADTAWLVRPSKVAIENSAIKTFLSNGNTVAITLRELKPFDKRLGIKQENYEKAFADLCNTLIAKGFQILACSTCTGIDGYQKDDRMVAYRVLKQIEDRSKFKVVMDEFNDIELGTVLSECLITIGTRLHSAIISMNFGTPAFALNYEHKSEGIMNQLGLSEFGIPLEQLINGELADKVLDSLEKQEAVKGAVSKAVKNEKDRAASMISQLHSSNR